MIEFYMIYIKRLDSVSTEKVQAKMDLARSWYRINDTLWIVHTTSDPAKWYDRPGPLVKESGSLLIMKLDVSSRSGWINKKFWAWLKERRSQA